MLVKYHWKTQQGIESMTQAEADTVQATDSAVLGLVGAVTVTTGAVVSTV